ncbi:protein prenyltransferase alpha subunit repeat-containing protein 1 [Dunckerocampus dactyliophorus]|uniref:protein prenyltransferase alpha subunit repeat-containing protein 1 n=1 Tax=Dunckerocampus dactyliophorus TaxID=161453 RepID=UPI002405BC40|nr:protein prenyltransferase alpha subunit repeat-containing protein 1 [Dunckerocampus dactyliophorus]XP_054630598.1 protein prenyltransferase alpha subunit repeat-containing protein 1 [Dunckerocampus dactyliophorus]XP_054630599.1 protein prenyltransferase alpha subunit repeat-containing protein 1 [Dunckerocampus dactyliophorus]
MAESEEEVDVLVQRVVKDITNAFKRNPNIDEIGVIPCPEARYNRSPIVLVENKLGIESWCVKFLLPYVHNKLVLYRQRKHWLDREALVDITSTLLLLNPDFTTAWNVRKELLQCGVFNPEKDLYLGKLALTKFPKSPETWIHRRWVLQQILRRLSAVDCSGKQQQQQQQQQRGEAEQANAERSQQLSEQLARTLQQELMICSDAACRYPSNYNAWSHRIWVLQHMAKGNVKVFHDELSSMGQWVSMHVSDHSGFHYRQFLLKELITEFSQTRAPSNNSSLQHPSRTVPSSCPLHSSNFQVNGELSGTEAVDEDERELELAKLFELFHQEMVLCTDLIQSFPGHETLWSHRRHIFYLWHQWRLEHHLQHLNSNGGSVHHDAGDTGLPKAGAPCCRNWEDDVNGQRHAVMEVDGVSLPDPRNSKRLKRGVHLPSLPSLSSECTFVSAILERTCNAEQRRFASAYKKWLDTVIGKEL